jgi:hypothetical protein
VNNRELLLCYLLSDLAPEKLSEIDARLLSDDAFCDGMEEAYLDLLDAYAAGELSEAQQVRVRRALLSHPLGERRLRLARALETQTPLARKAVKATSSSLRGFLWRAAVAVACLVIVAAAVSYLRPRARHATSGRQSPVSTATTTSSAGAKSALPGHPGKTAFAILLGPAIERGAGALRIVVVPRGIREVEVEILLPAGETGMLYQVRVQSPRGATLNRFPGLTPRLVFSHELLQFHLVASQLAPGLYTFRVYRKSGASTVPLSSYQIEIERQPNSAHK